MFLTFFWAALPVIGSILLMRAPLPDMNTAPPTASAGNTKKRTKGLILCILCIFLGSCAENTMANWIAAYAENALGIPKVWGDLVGMMLFAVLLAVSRSVYAKFGKNIWKVMMLGMAGSAVCYLVASISPSATVSLIACVAIGICASMLWPGTLILMEEKLPGVGVATYALMAAGGDLGASVAPQSFGIIVDQVATAPWAQTLGDSLCMTPEQIGFRAALLIVAVLPLLGLMVLMYIRKFFK
jgi:fucose permease